LGAFLFGSEDYAKKVKVLSGGEKSRLALAKLLLKECNLLILDEPTNHLDIAAKEVLKQALLDYNGTLIVVSHDREFLQGLTDRTFEFKEGRVKEHTGSIDDLYNYQIKNFREFEGAKKQEVKKERIEEKPKTVSQSSGLTNKERKEKEKERKRLKNGLSNFERKIEESEKQIVDLETKMADPNEAKNNQELFFKHAEYQKTLDQLMQNWEKTGEELDQLNDLLDRS
jgi:ATP-binding cassette subfamily F protein 3